VIVYLATSSHLYTIQRYLKSIWGRDLSELILYRSYQEVFSLRQIPPATYIFADLERLNPSQAKAAARIWQSFLDSKTVPSSQYRLLNHPTRVMRRYELLRNLYERGINTFNVYYLTECRHPSQFPVFLRTETDHQGSQSPLLQNQDELNQAIADLNKKGLSRDNKMICEFCNTADSEGIYRKYSALKIGDRIIAQHLFFSHNWVLKFPDLLADRLLEEELHYLQTNPHTDRLQEIFHLARIDFGRIDYSLVNDRFYIWEINTNPVTLPDSIPGSETALKRLRANEIFSKHYREALLAIRTNSP
jgi:hypothetical protein